MLNKANMVFFFAAGLIEIFLILFTILNIDGNIPLYMFVYFEMFLLMILAYFLIKNNFVHLSLPQVITTSLQKITGIKTDLDLPIIIIAAGILFRLTLFSTALTTSPDAYRYIWEGKVIVNGFNPYEYEPLNPALKSLHTEDLPSKVTFNEKKAIYPPMAQYMFAAAYLISGEDLWGLKLIYLIFEIITMFFILKLLHLKRKNLNLVLLYAWMPLPVLEYFVNAHLDVLGISFLIIFIYLFEKGSYYKSAVFFSFAVLTKFFPLFLFPLLIKRGGLKKTFILGCILVLFTVLFYLPFYSGKVNIFSFLMLYLEKWEFNASVYYILKNLLNGETARIICAVSFIITTGIIAYFYEDFTKAAAGIFIAFIIFASTVYPWYLGWLAVLTPLQMFYSVMGILFTSNFSNFTPLGSIWKEYYIVLLIEYLTFFVLLTIDLIKELKIKDQTKLPHS